MCATIVGKDARRCRAARRRPPCAPTRDGAPSDAGNSVSSNSASANRSENVRKTPSLAAAAHRRDDRGVDAARQVAARRERPRAACAAASRSPASRAESFRGLRESHRTRAVADAVARCPIGSRCQTRRRPPDRSIVSVWAGRQLAESRRTACTGDSVVQNVKTWSMPDRIDRPRHAGIGEDRLDLGGEQQAVPRDACSRAAGRRAGPGPGRAASRGASQRANANWPLKRRTQRSPQASKAWTMTSVSDAVRNRWPEATSSSAELDVIEDLAVEDDPERFVLVGEGCCPVDRSMIDSRACASPAIPST